MPEFGDIRLKCYAKRHFPAKPGTIFFPLLYPMQDIFSRQIPHPKNPPCPENFFPQNPPDPPIFYPPAMTAPNIWGGAVGG
ncbi:MAG: hypothetical protein K2P87_11830, partial [Lachnospiraceae bacterium]|nr:hypothetical protein [Lachnospiraceae bacterium]